MKMMKSIAAFAFAFGIGLGFTAPSYAVYPKCILDQLCYNDCMSGLGSASFCHRSCCD